MHWRNAYREQTEEHAATMRRERDLGDWRPYDVPGSLRMVPAREMTDAQISVTALWLAEQDANRAMKEHRVS